MIPRTVYDIQRLKFVPVGSGRWRSDTPSQPGWYNASVQRHPRMLRWWDGQYWSDPVRPETAFDVVVRIAARPAPSGLAIKWRPLRKELRK